MEARRNTLPPPEWSGSGPEPHPPGATPTDRWTGRPAEEGALRARLEEARIAGNGPLERRTMVTLARHLAANERDLDEACQLALAALREAPDAELRRDVAGWLEGLGDAALAAAVLRGAAEDQAGAPDSQKEGAAAVDAELFVRVGVLHARAGDPNGAAEAFEDAAQTDANDAMGLELRGTLAAWAPETVSPAQAAESYVESARRRIASGGDGMEDLLRGFEADASSALAAGELASTLEAEGRGLAADEILRAHARALQPKDPVRARSVHARRRGDASVADDTPRALGAALDEGLDSAFDGEPAGTLNELLLRCGLHEALFARLEVAAERASGHVRVALLGSLARLADGALAHPDRAALAYADVLAREPADDDARAALAVYAAQAPESVAFALETGDYAAVRRLVLARLAKSDPRYGEAIARSLRERASGDNNAAHAITRPFAEDPKLPSRVAAVAWVNASLAADAETQARALGPLAYDSSPPVRAVLFAVSAERLFREGDRALARSLAERACQADPTHPRGVAELAQIVAGALDRIAASALERAVRFVCARGVYCAPLADALEAMGELPYAVAWTQRFVALRPGDREATALLLERVARAKDAGRLGDALSWALSQPQPAFALSEHVARGLLDLVALDPTRAVVVGRRVLDVFGPRRPSLRHALSDVATRAGDAALGAQVIERWLYAGAPPEERAGLFLEAARLRATMGDSGGAARGLLRAIIEGAAAPALREVIGGIDERGLSGDGRLAMLELEARLAEAEEKPHAAAAAFRRLGAARWDLASDPRGAIRAWLRAAELCPESGYFTFAIDVVGFGDARLALDTLEELALGELDRKRSSRIATAAARAAVATGELARALELASFALERDPSRTEALAVAESGASGEGRPEAIVPLYERTLSRALGRYGRRGVHYRAARFFERHGDMRRAMRHAVEAFVAVPSEGTAFRALERLSRATGDHVAAAQAAERVAEEHKGGLRAFWLVRSARLAGGDEEGIRARVDRLLRAALITFDTATLTELAEAARALVKAVPAEAASLELRLARAGKVVADRAEGPDAVRALLRFVELMVGLFPQGAAATTLLAKALSVDADLDEYARLAPFAVALATSDAPGELLSKAVALVLQPYTNVGAPALKLLSDVARVSGDAPLADRFLVLAALRDPEDAALVRRADDLARKLGDDKLQGEFERKLPKDERALLYRGYAATQAEKDGFDAAIATLVRAMELAEDDADLQGQIGRELETFRVRKSREVDPAKRSLRPPPMASPAAPAALPRVVLPEPRPPMARDEELDVALDLRDRGEYPAALALAKKIAARRPDDDEAYALWGEVARLLGNEAEVGRALSASVDGLGLPADVASDRLIEAAQSAARAGDPKTSLARAQRAAELTPARAPAQLFARGLEYRARAAGSLDDARRTLAELARIEGELDPADVVLRTFLEAEALVACRREEEALVRLRAAEAALGPQPLIELGLGERLLARGASREAMRHFHVALSGSFLGFRPRGIVALEAADAALDAGEVSTALGWIDLAAEDEQTKGAALKKRAAVALGLSNGGLTRTGEDGMMGAGGGDGGTVAPDAMRFSVAPPLSGPSGEEGLWTQLMGGDLDAGDALAKLLETGGGERTSDLVRVRRELASRAPGDVRRLDALRSAAMTDANLPYARAVEHVIRATDRGAGNLPSPAVGLLVEQPGIGSLLQRPSAGPVGELLGLLQQGIGKLFVREPADYGITGLELVAGGPESPLARVYALALHLLALPKIPLYCKRGSSADGAEAGSAAFLATPSAVVVGDLGGDGAAARYALGTALSAALPGHALLLALPEAEARTVIGAAHAAFGTGSMRGSVPPTAGRVIETLWQALPVRLQRRAQDALRELAGVSFESLREAVRATGRRYGLFLSGDFPTAVTAYLAELGTVHPELALEDAGLARLAESYPGVLDLYRLAIHPAYAAARWATIPSGKPREITSSGRFRMV